MNEELIKMREVFKKFKIEEETKFCMDYDDFNDLVIEYLPALVNNSDRYEDFECIAEFEWNNDSNYDTEITEKYKLDDYERKDIMEGSHFLGFHQILSFLVEHKILPYGKYEVKVSW